MIFDPSSLQDLVHLPSTLLADAVDSVTAAVETTVPAVASPDAAAAAAAANSGNGGFGFLTEPIQFLVTAFHSILVSMGMSADAWGISIITMTLFIKLVTYPLTKSQLESTTKMQVRPPYPIIPLHFSISFILIFFYSPYNPSLKTFKPSINPTPML
jgi:YidC/Oxa1 family membrane protein insertase